MKKSVHYPRRAASIVLPTLLFAVAACGDDDPIASGPTDDITQIVAGTADVSTLGAALSAAGLTTSLQADGPFTVFAPSNAAFDALGADVVAALLEPNNLELLRSVLTFHVVPGVGAFSGDLMDGQKVATLNGDELTLGVSGSGVTVNGARVTTADIEASNGVIHLIDAVLLPEVDLVDKAILTEATQTLAAAVAAGGLVSTLKGAGPFTVFAPTNTAFEALGADKLAVLLDPANQALLQKILTYHVIAGEVLEADLTDGAAVATVEGSTVKIDLSGPVPMVNGAGIIATDIAAKNGVVHLIDGLLAENLDIMDAAQLNGLSTLVDLVRTAGLENTLRDDNGGNGFTVFAPTNEALAALSSVPSGQALVDVLTYHVVSGTVGSGDLYDGQVVATVQGAKFTVGIDGSSVTLTDAAGNVLTVVLADIPAANGVVHVIDGVLLPG